MTKYIVARREIYIQDVEVEAESVEDAIARVQDGEGEDSGEPRYYSTEDDDIEESDVRLAVGCETCGSTILNDDENILHYADFGCR